MFKIRLLLAIMLICTMFTGYAQPKWKSFVLDKSTGDTLNRVDKQGYKQGPWVEHVEALRGERGYDAQGAYADDKKVGRWLKFSPMGDKIADENYRWGQKEGKCKYYTLVGIIEREEMWRAIDPKKEYDTVPVYDISDPKKVKKYEIVKVSGNTVKHGQWRYFDSETGYVVKKENYWMDAMTSEELPTAMLEGKEEEKAKSTKNLLNEDGKKNIPKPVIAMEYEKKSKGKKRRKRDGQTGL